jgi:hypothetical protein
MNQLADLGYKKYLSFKITQIHPVFRTNDNVCQRKD